MTIPTFDRIIFPLLQTLSQHPDGLRARDAAELVADRLGITPAEREELLPSGTQEVYRNRIAWAHDRLKRGAYSESPARGIWKITTKGMEFVAAHPEGFTEDERTYLAFRIHNKKHLTETIVNNAGELPAVDATPRETIERAVQQLEESVAEELIQLVLGSSPSFFEKLVVDLLLAMGYGLRKGVIQDGGKSGDGGIDGIIALDRLGLEKVYLQAKRWSSEHCVGSPEVQRFFGALAGRKAKKGVFITTSYFSKDAEEFARQVSDSIVLIDGEKLAELMIEAGIGVSTEKSVKLMKVDTDYFDPPLT